MRTCGRKKLTGFQEQLAVRSDYNECGERRERETGAAHEEVEAGASGENVHKFNLPGQSHEHTHVFIFLYLHEIVEAP